MINVDIKYTISLTVSHNDVQKTFNTTLIKNIDFEINKATLISEQNISTYFNTYINKYCNSNNVYVNDLVIENYNVNSVTDGLYMYFESDKLYALYNPSMCIVKIQGTQIDNKTIRWSWDNYIEGMKLVDENDSVIFDIDKNNNYYLENDLKYNTTYTRKIIGENIVCTPLSITTSMDYPYESYNYTKAYERDESIEDINTSSAMRLKAFQSGVGSGEDCKIYKSDIHDSDKEFSFVNKIYGTRASDEIKMNTIKFDYRYKATGKADISCYSGSFKFKLSATQVNLNGSEIANAKTTTSSEYVFIFEDDIHVANLHYNEILSELNPQYKYKFSLQFSELNGTLTINTRTNGTTTKKYNNEKLTIVEVGNTDWFCLVDGSIITKTIEHVIYNPPIEYDPLTSVVNGEFEVSINGKKDYTEQSHYFTYNDSLYDFKIECEVEKIYPENAYIYYEFKNEKSGERYTRVNGDTITFSSNYIFENNNSVRDYIMSVESGKYFIDDNKRHTYNYTIDNIKIPYNSYENFIVETVSASDTVMLLSTSNNVSISNEILSADISAEVRALSSDASKWYASIHTGYYYNNNEERYLYNKCKISGDNVIFSGDYVKENINIKTEINVLSNDTTTIHESINYNSKKDLLTDYRYNWINGYVCIPYIISNGYVEFEKEYIYDSAPLLYEYTPTSLDNVSWDEVKYPSDSIVCNLVSYDHVNGGWKKPVPLENGCSVTNQSMLSKTMKLAFVIKKQVLKTATFITNIYCSESSWRRNSVDFMCKNITYNNETLQVKSYKSYAEYVSKCYCLGSSETKDYTASFALDTNKTSSAKGLYEIYIQEYDSYPGDDYIDVDDWKLAGDISNIKCKEFFRFKLKFKDISITHMSLKLKIYKYPDNVINELPGVKNINIKSTYDPSISSTLYQYIDSKQIIYDGKEHILESDLSEYLKDIANIYDFNIERVDSFSISGHNSNNLIINYDSDKTSSDAVVYKTKLISSVTDSDVSSDFGVVVSLTDNITSISPIPKAYAPIILFEEYENVLGFDIEDKKPYTHVFFTDEHGNYTLTNKEKFVSKGFNTYYLKYINIDDSSVSISIDGARVSSLFTLYNNVLKFNEKFPIGSVIEVSYKLRESMCVNYDYDNDLAIIEVNKVGNSIVDKMRIYYETEDDTSIKKLENIALNPIYTAKYNGYIYICDYTLEPSSVELIASSDIVYANRKDEIIILAKIKDINGNPVEGAKANIVCAKGKIVNKNKYRYSDQNGIIKYIYTGCDSTCIDTIKICVTSIVKDSITIMNKKI